MGGQNSALKDILVGADMSNHVCRICAAGQVSESQTCAVYRTA
jgi:hypothetical protein